ncbi:MAG: ATP-dependent Clp protease proteolytic subunit [Planctomycetota bacterium]
MDPRRSAEENEEPEEKLGGLFMRLIKRRTVLLTRPIDKRVMERFTIAVLLMEFEDPDAPINLIVNSPGGDADSGFAMYDLLRFVKPKVRSLCAGLCASAAIPVFLGAEPGERYSLPNSRFLLHQPSMQTMGVASDVEITANELVKVRDRYNEIVAREINRPAKQIAKDVNRDFWLTAQEAQEYGLVTKVIEKRAEFE